MSDKRPIIKGFSLIELLTVVLIIGILAAVAIPSYTKYIRKSRLSEALSNLTAIDTYEETYYSENDQYLCLARNPFTVPSGGNRQNFDGTLTDWSALGSVIANNTPVNFQYEAWAGHFADTGSPPALTTGIVGMTCYQSSYDEVVHPGAGASCINVAETAISASALAIPRTSSSSFFFISAVSDQKPNNICSMLVKVIDRPDIYTVNEIE